MTALMTTVRIVVDLLVRQEYDVIEAMTRGHRLSAEDIQTAIERYGRTLIAPPEDGWNAVEIYRVESSSAPRFSVDVPLWSREEGLSELTLSLTLLEFAPGLFETQVDDLRVQ
ncbi:hypothetical protein [Kribbella sp. NPDC050469]